MSSLSGKRIVITRPPHKAQAFADQLRALGAEPILLPMIAIQPLEDTQILDAKLRQYYDWAIFTSANTVQQVWRRFDALRIQPRFGQVAAIGPATAQALQARGVEADVIPDRHVAEALFDALAARIDLSQQRILLPQGNLARPVLANLLAEAGAEVDAVAAYCTVQTEAAGVLGSFDAITFTSSSTVTNFAAQFDDPCGKIGDALVACIGPVTAETAQAVGLPVHVIAHPHTVAGLINRLSEHFGRNITA